MATIIRMPEVLANATEAAIQSWLVAVGDTIIVGQPLAEIETEKAMVEYNAEVAGVVVRLLVEPGASVDVGVPIGVIGAASESEADIDRLLSGETAPQGASSDAVNDASLTSPNATTNPGTSAAIASPTPVAERRFASPLVRRIAKEQSLDLVGVTGSGPGGRIVRRDVENLRVAPPADVVDQAEVVEQAPNALVATDAAAHSAAPAQAAPTSAAPSTAASTSGAASQTFTDVPLTGMRRAIARRLTESKSTVPHFYITADVRVDKLLALKAEVNRTAPRKISVNDFVVKAVSSALRLVPAANVIWAGTAIRHFAGVDLAIAVSTDGGLLTPVLRGVENLSLSAVSEQIADLAVRARSGKLRQNELEGGSFSVSNLGMFGVDEFSAIVNPPQSAILAVGAAKKRAVVQGNELVIGTVMTVTLSADHRVIDGAVGAEWLAAFVQLIENPLSLLI